MHVWQATRKAKVKVIRHCWRFNVRTNLLCFVHKTRSFVRPILSHDYTSNCFSFFSLFPLILFRSFSHKVAPICRPGQVQTYNVGRGETAQIQCEVEGIPRDINFVWKFNTSVSEVLDMPSSIVKNNGTRSIIHFKPMTEHVI